MPGDNSVWHKPWWRWVIPFLTSSLIFVNHYCRDSVGALEKQLESEVGITPAQYGHLNALYFLPNVITPLLVGTAANKLGGAPTCLVLAVICASFGHLVFAYAVEVQSVGLLFMGRVLAGSVYEVIDFLPIVCTGALFKDEWGTIVGATNAFLRSGSVATFIICPYLYENLGLTKAMWFSASLAVASIAIAFGARYLTRQLSDTYKAHHELDEEPEKPETKNSPPAQDSGFMSSPASAYALQKRKSRSASEMSANSDVATAGTENSEPPLSLEPFKKLSYTYYLYMFAGLTLYGSMVPFWFTGSKFLQEAYGLSVQSADALLLIPEGSIIALSFPLGYILDNHLKGAPNRLMALGLSTALLPIAYAMLILGANESGDGAPTASPVFAVFILGVGYGISNCMYWTSLMQLVPENLIGPASGLIASSLNVMPAVVPVIASFDVPFATPGVWNLLILSVLGVISTCCSVAASRRYSMMTAVYLPRMFSEVGDPEEGTRLIQKEQQKKKGGYSTLN
jgi:MFS family permease